MRKLTFTIRDLFLAPCLAFSCRKIRVATEGLLYAWLMYAAISYSVLLAFNNEIDSSLSILFRYFELYPSLSLSENGAAAYIIWTAGIAAAVTALIVAGVAVSRIAFEDLRGNTVFQVKDARSFAVGRIVHLIYPVAIPLITAASVFLIIFMSGYIGKIPLVGPVIIGLSTIPIIVMTFFGLCLVYIFTAGLGIVPAIDAVMGDAGIETLIQTVVTVCRRPVMFIAYEITALLITISCTAAAIIAVIAAYHTMNVLLALCLGETYYSIAMVSLYRLPVIMNSDACIATMSGIGSAIGFHYIIDTSGASNAVITAGWLMGFSLCAVLAVVASYMFVVFETAQTIIYITLRKQAVGADMRLKTHSADFIPFIPAENVENN